MGERHKYEDKVVSKSIKIIKKYKMVQMQNDIKDTKYTK